MNERLEERSIEKPDWFEMSEPEMVRHTYWGVSGTIRNQKPRFWDRFVKRDEVRLWSILFHSKEEAEAEASSPSDFWEWDRNPAGPRSLADVMRLARKNGRLGVAVQAWKDGRWQIVKRWPASEPLQGEDL